MTQAEATLVELQGRQSVLKQQFKACNRLIVKSRSTGERDAVKEELATKRSLERNQVERRIAANDGRAQGNRGRVPISAILYLGADGRSMRPPAETFTADGATPKTDAPGPFGRPGVSVSSTEVGRGDSICTLVPTFLGIILREVPQHYAWPDVAKYKPPRIPPPTSGNWRRIRINQGGGISAGELAARAGIAQTTLYRWREEGLVPPFPLRDGVVMWLPDEVAEWLGIIEAVAARRVAEPGPGRSLAARICCPPGDRPYLVVRPTLARKPCILGPFHPTAQMVEAH